MSANFFKLPESDKRKIWAALLKEWAAKKAANRAQRFQLATFQRGTGCAGGAPSGAFLPFAGGVRFSTLPGSALGVGLELSEL